MKGHCDLSACNLPLAPVLLLGLSVILLILGIWWMIND